MNLNDPIGDNIPNWVLLSVSPLFGLAKRENTNINMNLGTGIRESEYRYEYLLHTALVRHIPQAGWEP